MRKKIVFLILLLMIFFPIKAKALSYQVHVQDIGWMDYVGDNKLAGTTGKCKRLEAIRIKLDENESDEPGIEYQVHVQDIGWMDYVGENELAGTTGQRKRLEAIRIKLTNSLKEKYSISYRVHVQDIGWMNYVGENELAGTTGQRKRLEAIQIRLTRKDDSNAFIEYTSHNVDGWQEYIEDGYSGSVGEAKKIDLLKIKINNGNLSGSVNYNVYTTMNGWQEETNDDKSSGIENDSIEALKIYLSGELAEMYNIYYRVHISNIGWMDWTSNGKPTGTPGFFNNIEAFEIKLLPKEDDSIKEGDYYYDESINKVTYSSHVSNIGWMNYVDNGVISGTEGRALALEAFKIKLDTKINGNIIYNAYVARRGWSQNITNDGIAGTTGLNRKMEAIKIKLEGSISKFFDIYYRVHVSNIGWLSWTSNGNPAGCIDSNTQIEAIQLKLIKKGEKNSLDTSKPFVTGEWKNNNTNYFDYFGRKATGFKLINGIKHYFNSAGKLYGKNVKKIIDVSSWQDVIDWEKIKKDDDVDGAIIRVGWGTSYGGDCGMDSYFDRNIKEVQRLGIPYGVYIYAYAANEAGAKKEAEFVVSQMKKYNMPSDTFVWYDAELNSLSRQTYDYVIPIFINSVKASGYNNVGVYSGVSQLDTTNGNTNTDKIRSYPIWVSQYYRELQYTGEYVGWQFASDEYVNGISGYVDVSMFK